jgi:DcuC family C4-dicarboxylate transporter
MMVSLGVSKPAAAAMIALCSFMDLGPAVGTANLAARTAGIPPAVYFVRYQIPVVVWVIGVVAILIFSSARYFDRRSDSSIFQAQPEPSMGEQIRNDAPGFYAFLPLFPITLILVFSPLLVSDVTVDVVTAMVLGSVAGLVCELLVKRDVRAVFKGFQVFLTVSDQALPVWCPCCADVFAQGLEVVGAVGYLIESVRDAGFGINVMAFIMTLLVGVTAMIERKWTSGFSLAGTFEGEFSNVTRSYAGKGVVRYAW